MLLCLVKEFGYWTEYPCLLETKRAKYTLENLLVCFGNTETKAFLFKDWERHHHITLWHLGKLYDIESEKTIRVFPKCQSVIPDVSNVLTSLLGDIIAVYTRAVCAHTNFRRMT